MAVGALKNCTKFSSKCNNKYYPLFHYRFWHEVENPMKKKRQIGACLYASVCRQVLISSPGRGDLVWVVTSTRRDGRQTQRVVSSNNLYLSVFYLVRQSFWFWLTVHLRHIKYVYVSIGFYAILLLYCAYTVM